jgi:hypothetical protein
MEIYSLLLLAFAAIFLLSWAFVAWLKFREHHHILRDEYHHHKTHLTWVGRILPWRRRH